MSGIFREIMVCPVGAQTQNVSFLERSLTNLMLLLYGIH
jgi:hypothetical protein